MRGTTTEQIILSYRYTSNLQDLFYKMTTGRLFTDFEILQLFKVNSLREFTSEVRRVNDTWFGFGRKVPTQQEMESAKWITPTSKKIAKRIIKLAN